MKRELRDYLFPTLSVTEIVTEKGIAESIEETAFEDLDESDGWSWDSF